MFRASLCPSSGEHDVSSLQLLLATIRKNEALKRHIYRVNNTTLPFTSGHQRHHRLSRNFQVHNVHILWPWWSVTLTASEMAEPRDVTQCRQHHMQKVARNNRAQIIYSRASPFKKYRCPVATAHSLGRCQASRFNTCSYNLYSIKCLWAEISCGALRLSLREKHPVASGGAGVETWRL